MISYDPRFGREYVYHHSSDEEMEVFFRPSFDLHTIREASIEELEALSDTSIESSASLKDQERSLEDDHKESNIENPPAVPIPRARKINQMNQRKPVYHEELVILSGFLENDQSEIKQNSTICNEEITGNSTTAIFNDGKRAPNDGELPDVVKGTESPEPLEILTEDDFWSDDELEEAFKHKIPTEDFEYSGQNRAVQFQGPEQHNDQNEETIEKQQLSVRKMDWSVQKQEKFIDDDKSILKKQKDIKTEPEMNTNKYEPLKHSIEQKEVNKVQDKHNNISKPICEEEEMESKKSPNKDQFVEKKSKMTPKVQENPQTVLEVESSVQKEDISVQHNPQVFMNPIEAHHHAKIRDIMLQATDNFKHVIQPHEEEENQTVPKTLKSIPIENEELEDFRRGTRQRSTIRRKKRVEQTESLRRIRQPSNAKNPGRKITFIDIKTWEERNKERSLENIVLCYSF